ncbi:MAG: LuxR C-terminal-related transcriptional regulator [Myxococcota bacterium]
MNELRAVVRVGILEDLRVMRDSLADVMTFAGFDVVLASGSAEEFLSELPSKTPDVALIDLVLDGGEDRRSEPGWRAVASMREWYPEVRVLVLSGERDSQGLERAYREGVAGYLLKHDTSSQGLVAAVRAIAAGQRIFPVESQLPNRAPELKPRVPEVLGVLTAREREVLRCVAAGADNLKIAALLDITERTVRAHVSSLYRKLGSENRAQLVLLARRLGVRPPTEM